MFEYVQWKKLSVLRYELTGLRHLTMSDDTEVSEPEHWLHSKYADSSSLSLSLSLPLFIYIYIYIGL